MKQRRIPLRKCVACQEMIPKKSLIRVVRTPDEQILIDITGKKSGRGAYLCSRISCFQLAKKKKALDKSLKHPVSDKVYDELEQDFIQSEDEIRSRELEEEVNDRE